MGYFHRKLSRERCRRSIRRVEERSRYDAVTSVNDLPLTPFSGAVAGFVRFADSDNDPTLGTFVGVFHACFSLTGLDDARRSALERHLGWFADNLKAPTTIDTAAAVFWFREDASECIQRAWALVHCLRDSGRRLRLLRTTRPGRIIYRDALQVAAVPFSKRPWRQRLM